MKIFNWVHKTFHHTALKEGFAQIGTKKTETSAINEVDRHALLKQVDLEVEAYHCWRDGILTIGTFGFESLKPSNEQKEYLVLQSEEDDYKDYEEEEEEEKSFVHEEDDDIVNYFEDEELNPLMLTAFEHKSRDVSVEKGGDLIIGAYELNMESEYSAIIEMEDEEEKKKKGESRITLADLFLADAGDVGIMGLEDHKVLQKKAADVRSKSSLSFAKKLMPRVKEDSHPIKNFQRLMRRMLKRKIHPEIEKKINKTSSANQIGFESLSLLPTQDAVA